MAIDLIENSELGALSKSRLGDKNFIDAPKIAPTQGLDAYNNFLGLPKGLTALSPAALVAGAVKDANVSKNAGNLRGYSQLDDAFRSALVYHYDLMKKADTGEYNVAIAEIGKPNGFEAAFQVVKDFGAPSSAANFAKYNQQVNVYRTYFIPDSKKQTLDCQNLFSLKSQIEADIKAANEQQSSGGSAKSIAGAIQALSKRKAVVEKLISSGDCVAKAEKAAAEASTRDTLAQLQAATASGADGKKTNYLLYAAYGIGGVLVISALYMLLKKKS